MVPALRRFITVAKEPNASIFHFKLYSLCCWGRNKNIRFRLGTHLFVKVPRPGDSEGTPAVFESSCHLLLPV